MSDVVARRKAPRILLPYTPRSVFMPYHGRNTRFAIGVAHRRCGKTVSCLNDLIRRAWRNKRQHPPVRSAYIGPQLNQSKDNVWQYLKWYAKPLMRAKNESDLWVELHNGARIRVYGADNPDRLRGAYLDDVLLDEYADMHPALWGTVVRPMLSDYQGSATFIGTPKGRNDFFRMYERAGGLDDWSTFFLPASLTGVLPQSELDAARLDMTAEEYEQEYECSFNAAILGAYYAKEMAMADACGHVGDVPVIPSLPVHTAWDLGDGQNMAIWAFQLHGETIRVVGFLSRPGLNMKTYCAELDALGWNTGTDFVPHDARAKEISTGLTRIETLISCARNPHIVASHYVEDGINAVRVIMPRVRFDAIACKDGIEALRQYRSEWDAKSKVFKPTPKHDWASHPSDAFRYLAMADKTARGEMQGPPRVKILGVGAHNDVSLHDIMPKHKLERRPT